MKKFGDPAVRVPRSLAEREFYVDKPIVSAWEKACYRLLLQRVHCPAVLEFLLLPNRL